MILALLGTVLSLRFLPIAVPYSEGLPVALSVPCPVLLFGSFVGYGYLPTYHYSATSEVSSML